MESIYPKPKIFLPYLAEETFKQNHVNTNKTNSRKPRAKITIKLFLGACTTHDISKRIHESEFNVINLP